MNRSTHRRATPLAGRRHDQPVIAASVLAAAAMTGLGVWTVAADAGHTGPTRLQAQPGGLSGHLPGVAPAMPRSGRSGTVVGGPSRVGHLVGAPSDPRLGPCTLWEGDAGSFDPNSPIPCCELELWSYLEGADIDPLEWTDLAPELSAEELRLVLFWYASGELTMPTPIDPPEIQ